MSKTTSAQESATAASLHVSWTLARAKKPFADAELIKRCAIEMAREVLNPDEKQQKKVVELLKQVPLSANTATRAAVFAYSARAHDRRNNLPRADTVLRKEWFECESNRLCCNRRGSVDGWKAQRLGKQAFRR
ncbi:hypothetical protein OYC64_015207 [Pagothenia borchgrevinki]|uniref:Uncharacterized protein n=1 Tax=Pagothenia borchgrevinki TaxID=8213 RepID=A0ABD2H4S1_PAGBO